MAWEEGQKFLLEEFPFPSGNASEQLVAKKSLGLDRNFWSCICLISCSSGLVLAFSLMWVYGAIKATEPNILIRGFELAVFTGMMFFGFYCLHEWFKRNK